MVTRNRIVHHMELSDLYSEKILELAANTPRAPRLASAHASARRVSRVCGSVVEVDLVVIAGRVADYGHSVAACALGQASAAVMAANIIGANVDELRLVRTQMIAMLKADGAPPTGERWSDLRYLEPVRDFRPRHASTLLVFEAVIDALEAIERRGVAERQVAAGA